MIALRVYVDPSVCLVPGLLSVEVPGHHPRSGNKSDREKAAGSAETSRSRSVSWPVSPTASPSVSYYSTNHTSNGCHSYSSPYSSLPPTGTELGVHLRLSRLRHPEQPALPAGWGHRVPRGRRRGRAEHGQRCSVLLPGTHRRHHLFVRQSAPKIQGEYEWSTVRLYFAQFLQTQSTPFAVH